MFNGRSRKEYKIIAVVFINTGNVPTLWIIKLKLLRPNSRELFLFHFRSSPISIIEPYLGSTTKFNYYKIFKT